MPRLDEPAGEVGDLDLHARADVDAVHDQQQLEARRSTRHAGDDSNGCAASPRLNGQAFPERRRRRVARDGRDLDHVPTLDLAPLVRPP
jgi:hypothetical protein